MFNRNYRAWAALAVTAALFAMTGQRCLPRRTTGPQVTVTATPTSGTNSVDVTLAATVTGGTEPYTYAWTASPAATITGADAANATATVTATTTFTCTVTDADSDTDSADATVTVTRAIVVTASAPGTAMGGETVNLVALVENETGAVSFSWLLTATGTAGSVTLSNQSSQTATAVFSADAAGTFSFRVTATDSAGSDTDTADIVVTPTGAGAGTTFTNDTDTLTGTAVDDIFDGSLFYNIYTDKWVNTVGNADSADGLDGNDEADIQLEEGANVNPMLANIETINVTVTDNNGGGAGAVTFNASKTTGLTAVNAVSCNDALNVTNLEAIPALGVSGSDQNVTLAFDADAVSGTTDEIDLTASNVDGGTWTIPDVEIANIESTGAANTIAALTMAALTEMVVTGDQDLEITAAIAATTFDDLDASGMTAGGVTITFPDAASNAISIVTGPGDDDVTAGTAADVVTATLGAGDDRLSLGGFTDGTDSADGGDGADTIALTNAVAVGVGAALADLDNFEALEITDGINGDVTVSYFGSVTQLILSAAIAGNSTVTVPDGAEVIVQVDDAGAHTFGVTSETNADDVLTLTLENGGVAFGGLTTLNGVEVLNIESTTAANTLTGLTFAPSAGVSSGSVTITGDEDLTMGTVTKGTPISASALTGNLSLTLAQSGTVTGGSGDDTLTGSANEDNLAGGDGADTLTGAAGADAITGGAGDDIINGGDGEDLMSGGAGTNTYRFVAGDLSGVPDASTIFDTITDFQAGVDVIDFTAGDLVIISGSAAASGTAAISAEGFATFHADDDSLAERIVATEAGINASGVAAARQFAVFESGSDSYIFVSDGTDGVDANDVLIKLTGETGLTDTTLTGGDLTID